MLGLVLIVPLFEELFWRSFVVRWIIEPDQFREVPIGRITPVAAAITAALFAVEHPAEWLPALLTGGLWAGLLWQTKSVSACFVSHAVANLGLGVYVLTTGAWKFW
jgi:CAAX prenyl protease-like protein